MISRRRTFALATVAAASLVMTACAGGSSDTVGAAAAEPAAGSSNINLFAYAVPKPGYDKLIPAFQATDAGKGVQFQQSYGASGDQSRKVDGRRPGRLRQLLGRARRHPPRRRRAGRRELERRRSTRASRSARS